MPNLETFEGNALAAGQEWYEQTQATVAMVTKWLEERRSSTADANVRLGLGIAIDTIKAKARAL